MDFFCPRFDNVDLFTFYLNLFEEICEFIRNWVFKPIFKPIFQSFPKKRNNLDKFHETYLIPNASLYRKYSIDLHCTPNDWFQDEGGVASK